MRGLKELPHSCFSFLLQISSKPFSVKDDQLIQYLIPVPVSLRPLFDYVLAGKIQHLFQCRLAWEYAFRFRDFPILAVQSFYDICRVHNASDIIRKLKKGTYIFPIIFPVTDRVRIFLPHFSFMFSSSVKAAVSFGALYTSLKSEENFFRSL